MENIVDKIDRYLDGKMSGDEKTSFENEMKSDQNLAAQVKVQQELRGGIERAGMKAQMAKTFKAKSLKSKIYKWGIATVAVATIGTAIYYGMNHSNSSSVDDNNITYTLPDVNETGTNTWADADRNLPTQLFTIDQTHDTVIETQSGIVFAIPARAFIGADGPVTLSIREAVSPMDIIKGGLSTKSDSNLLETGGMFCLDARVGNTILRIDPDKPISANVPTNEIKPGMMLFDGERKPDGSINWVNPKKMEKPLIPVDITTLDFYPKGFLAKVAELGFDANDKRVTDSIYYSYAGRKNSGFSLFQLDSALIVKQYYDSVANTKVMLNQIYEDALARALFSKNNAYAAAMQLENKNGNAAEKIANKKLADQMKADAENAYVMACTLAANAYDIAVGPNNPVQPSVKPDGKSLFQSKCATCHTIDGTMSTGPSLKDVLSRVPSIQWARDFTRDNYKLRASGDAYANAIYNKYKNSMTSFANLTDDQIDAIINYADCGGCDKDVLEINPARIAAIWDKKYNNTILATHEFEERLQVIFKYGDPKLLELYIDNLNQPMYYIDSLIAYTYNDKSYPEFVDFYNHHDGGIAIDQPHLAELKNYFSRRKQAMEDAAKKVYDAHKAEFDNAANAQANSQNAVASTDNQREFSNYKQEFAVNLKEACRQLGIREDIMTDPPKNYYIVPVTTPGWKNIDAYVMVSTVTRTTLDYTDPQSGKKAVIKYEELKINVADESNYEQLQVYLVPDSLSSFMKVQKKNNVYSENLNELFHYSLIVVGQKDGKWFYGRRDNVKPGTVDIQADEIAESQLRTNLETSFTTTAAKDFRTEINAMITTHQYNIALQKKQKQDEIDNAIMPVIFPYYQQPTGEDVARSMAK